MSTGSVVNVSGSPVLSLSTPSSGYMSGAFVHPILNSSKNLQGVALQQQNTARGFFLGTTQSGSFLLLPND